MRKIVQNKKGDMTAGTVVALVISVAIIAMAVYFIIFPTQFKTMLQNILPDMKGEANQSYGVIEGSDELADVVGDSGQIAPPVFNYIIVNTTKGANTESVYIFENAILSLRLCKVDASFWGNGYENAIYLKKYKNHIVLYLKETSFWFPKDVIVGAISLNGVVYFAYSPDDVGKYFLSKTTLDANQQVSLPCDTTWVGGQGPDNSRSYNTPDLILLKRFQNPVLYINDDLQANIQTNLLVDNYAKLASALKISTK
jgi:hypothetical protein